MCLFVLMGMWSDPRVLTTFQDVVGARYGEQKLIFGGDGSELIYCRVNPQVTLYLCTGKVQCY